MGVNPTTNEMANVRLKSSIYFDGENIRVSKSSSGLSPEIGSSTTPYPVIPVTGNAAQFEMLITPIGGSTGNIIRNDAANWTPLNGVKWAEHVLDVPDTSPAGTYTNDVSYTIQVRKISNPVDSVSGNITTINSLVVTNGGTDPGGGEPELYSLNATYLGQDSNVGEAEVRLQYTGTTIFFEARIRGSDTGNQWQRVDSETLTWIASLDNISNYAIQTTYLSGDNPFTVQNFSNISMMVSGTQEIARLNAGFDGPDVKQATLRLDIYRYNQPGAIYSKQFRFYVASLN